MPSYSSCETGTGKSPGFDPPRTHKLVARVVPGYDDFYVLESAIVVSIIERSCAEWRKISHDLISCDDFFFLAFSEHGSFVANFVPSSDQVLHRLQFVKPGGPSSLYDSVYLAAGRLKKSRNLKKAFS